ncbi:MAG TPA: sensor domain-containing diguanylate cyclase [Pyrinomonadaceae bacterium]|nr:sensor domain-containing diguanylate cyclase [Pyrinomonadaceae bacterium]
MKKSVIVISDPNAEIAPEILTILHESGLVARTADLWPGDHGAGHARLIAIVYQLAGLPAAGCLKELVQKFRAGWPELPLVACAPASVNQLPRWRETVAEAGFNAIAESAAQLPALLREVEEQQPADEPEQFNISPAENTWELTESLPRQQLRGAFTLVASLHLAANQSEAAALSINALGRLIKAERWTIFLSQNNAEPGSRLISLASTSFYEGDELSFDQNWSVPSIENPPVKQVAGKAVREVLATAALVRRSEDRKRILAAPLVSGQRVMGVVEGVRGIGSRGFSAHDVRTLKAVTSSIALALTNSVRIADAERLSLTDELTRLHNARYLRQFLVNEIKRARRYRTKVAALFLDLDDFKHVNDRHGHLAGSHCLMEMAALLLPSVRDTDCVVRYGGDEFVVILPEAGPEDAAIVAQRIRRKVETHRFTGGRRLRISLTVSIGAAVFPDDALSPHQLISSADQAMYAAKAGNKNCVRLAAQSLSIGKPDRPGARLIPGEQFQRIPDENLIS